ncbi:MAG: ATP phosphoribosyltransferase, partial [Planctomycetes bacterium]|nr:ATP phosphoribosyltransferase [Planctomycetota bacterium]
GKLPKRKLVFASEYERLAKKWIKDNAIDATFVRSYGATEVFPPDDADCIVDNTATGSTLRANNLEIIDTVMESSTRLFASKRALDDRQRRDTIEHFVLLLRSVLEARARVMLELNVPANKLEAVVAILPCMREPTVAKLHGDAGYAVKSAVPSEGLPILIGKIKQAGGSDIVVSSLSQIVP